MLRTSIKIILPFVLGTCIANAQKTVAYFPLNEVSLLPSEFQKAQLADKKYILELHPDKLAAPYLKEAGLTHKDTYYGNWESMGLGGHIGGHYVTALSIMYAATKDTAILYKLTYMLSQWKLAQDKNGNGYLGGVPDGNNLWKEIHAGKIKADAFSLNGRWVPLYNIHKTFAGLRDAYLYTGNPLAKTMFLKMCDWAVSTFGNLSETQMQNMLQSEHGGLNEIFIDAYKISHKKAYADLAIQFSHKAILDPLLENKDQLTSLHANTQIPKVIGFERIGEYLGKNNWENASTFFWKDVVEKRSVAFGGNSTYEHFNPINDFSGMLDGVQGPETCNSNNMLKLTQDIFSRDVQSGYVDYFEEVVYNHILSSQDKDNGGLVYFTPIRPDGYRVYSQPQTSFWCCVGSGMENHGKYGEMIYANADNNLMVNLFIPSVLDWKEKGRKVIQSTKFPEQPNSEIELKLTKNQSFTIFVRKPKWITSDDLVVTINGKKQTYPAQQNGYIAIARTWKNGDKLKVELPMHLSSEQLPDKSNFYAFKYGPILLATPTDTSKQVGLFADDSRGGHIATGPQTDFANIPIVSNADMKQLQLKRNTDFSFSINATNSDNRLTTYALEPFYKIDASRYIMYWPVATSNDISAFRKNVLAEKDQKLAIEKKTADVIYCGEQQSEIDHSIQYTNSNTGIWKDKHYRTIESEVSYQLKNTQQSNLLKLAFAPAENEANLKISLGNFSKNYVLKASNELQFIQIELPETSNENHLILSPIDHGQNIKLVEVRLIR